MAHAEPLAPTGTLMLRSPMKALRYVVYDEDGDFVSQCLDVDVASCGDTQDDAIANLKEALELRFDGEESQP